MRPVRVKENRQEDLDATMECRMPRYTGGLYNRAVSITFLLVFLFTLPAAAQVGFGTDIAFKTRHVWRGLTYRDAGVVQPDLFITLGKPTSLLTAGAWTTIALSEADTNDIGYNRNFGESNLWIEYAHAWEKVDVAAGLTTYLFNARRAVKLPIDTLINTHELHGRIQVHPLSRLDLGLAAWYDVGAVKGTYLEATLRIRLPFWNHFALPVGSLIVQGQAGLSRGQEKNKEKAKEMAYFEKAGVTHYDVSLILTSAYLPLGPFKGAFQAEFHVPSNQDLSTKNTKAWLGFTVTVLGLRCRPGRNICP